MTLIPIMEIALTFMLKCLECKETKPRNCFPISQFRDGRCLLCHQKVPQCADCGMLLTKSMSIGLKGRCQACWVTNRGSGA